MMRYKGLLNEIKIDWLKQEPGEDIFNEWYLLHYLSQFIYMVNAAYPIRVENEPLELHCKTPGCQISGNLIKAYAGSFCLMLDSKTPSLSFFDDHDNCISTLIVAEQTYPEIRAWISENLLSLGMDPLQIKDRIPYTIRIPGPDNLSNPRKPDSNNLLFINSLYCNLFRLLTEMSKRDKHMQLPYCRTDSFELLSPIVLRRNKRSRIVRSLEVGISPPDLSDSEACYFVRLFSADEFNPVSMPDLPFGFWRLDKRKEAVLPINTVNNQPDAQDQYQVLRDFLGFALDAAWGELMADY